MIRIKKIEKLYGKRKVLDISSLEIRKGETVVIAGPNGSGKSTLLKILAGIIKADEDDFTVEGKILYLPQKAIPFGKTLTKNIIFSMDDKHNKRLRSEDMLRQLGLLHLKDKNAVTLSGGECQRLALARVLVNDCDFLILDEPSSAADIEGNELIEKAIRAYKEKTGCAVIMTTHSPRQAKNLADRVIMLCNGEIVEDAAAAEILMKPKNEWTEKFISQWRIDV